MTTLRKITAKQARFVREYLIDLNGTQAAIRAKYSPKTAGIQSFDLLKKPNIQAAIQVEQQKRIERNNVDADYVLKRLTQIDEMNVLDIMNDDMTIKPLSQWPKTWLQTISGIDLMEVATQQQSVTAVLKKIKWPDKTKNLELLGKHVDVLAFKEQVRHDGELTVNNLISELSTRNAESRAVLPKMKKK